MEGLVRTGILSTLTSHYTDTTKPQRSSVAVMSDPVLQAQHRTVEFPTGLTKDVEKTKESAILPGSWPQLLIMFPLWNIFHAKRQMWKLEINPFSLSLQSQNACCNLRFSPWENTLSQWSPCLIPFSGKLRRLNFKSPTAIFIPSLLCHIFPSQYLV